MIWQRLLEPIYSDESQLQTFKLYLYVYRDEIRSGKINRQFANGFKRQDRDQQPH
jgi:hypothetical protein